jgi:hypothetical protein
VGNQGNFKVKIRTLPETPRTAVYRAWRGVADLFFCFGKEVAAMLKGSAFGWM